MIDWSAIRFGQASVLWLLAAPALLLVLWLWQLARRRRNPT